MREAWDTNLEQEAKRLVMEAKTLRVYAKNVYGRVLYYPINQTARTFADIAGKHTLTEAQIRLIKALGFAIELETPSIP